MKKYSILIIALLMLISVFSAILSSCAVSQKVQDKTGTQLWGENCARCHNAPGPGEFNDASWEVIGTHMRVRAHITETEEKKIIDYLKSTAN
jgi:cytochrome c2